MPKASAVVAAKHLQARCLSSARPIRGHQGAHFAFFCGKGLGRSFVCEAKPARLLHGCGVFGGTNWRGIGGTLPDGKQTAHQVNGLVGGQVKKRGFLCMNE